jgi:hypothetical protein
MTKNPHAHSLDMVSLQTERPGPFDGSEAVIKGDV